jgi:hypothetical protein
MLRSVYQHIEEHKDKVPDVASLLHSRSQSFCQISGELPQSCSQMPESTSPLSSDRLRDALQLRMANQ